jgi:hypothetical protein
VAQQIGIALGGTAVKPHDRTVITGALSQSGDQPASRGAGGEPCQWHRAPDTPAWHGFVMLRHLTLSQYPSV